MGMTAMLILLFVIEFFYFVFMYIIIGCFSFKCVCDSVQHAEIDLQQTEIFVQLGEREIAVK
jgi:hypothetical protein